MISKNSYKYLKDNYSLRLSERILNKSDSYYHEIDRVRYLTGRVLLSYALEDYLENTDLGRIQIDKSGRPFISNDYDFNISHSGEIVICAFGRSRLGVDIEKIQNINIESFESVWTNNESLVIKNSESINKSFFDLWTRKESVIKADGRGMSLQLNQLDVIENTVIIGEQKWFIRKVELHSEYTCHLAITDWEIEISSRRIYL